VAEERDASKPRAPVVKFGSTSFVTQGIQLIVEPTFTVIAFNPNHLTVALLALFSRIEVRATAYRAPALSR
jgi:hypothetical protein